MGWKATCFHVLFCGAPLYLLGILNKLVPCGARSSDVSMLPAAFCTTLRISPCLCKLCRYYDRCLSDKVTRPYRAASKIEKRLFSQKMDIQIVSPRGTNVYGFKTSLSSCWQERWQFADTSSSRTIASVESYLGRRLLFAS